MADYLLDTDHLSYMQKQIPSVVHRLSGLTIDDHVATSVVNAAELLQGIYLLPESGKRRALMDFYSRLTQSFEIVPVTLPVAEKLAEVHVTLQRKGRPIPVNDEWIAAVALVRGAVLVTNDDHFRHVDRLKLENWTR